ncbi:MAG TPA: hypothetical protein VMS93_11005 [Candidatus Saccharimonadales bacterium]|nr:hypothetical protein [Candidatus Saccharimonadales bacterium]
MIETDTLFHAGQGPAGAGEGGLAGEPAGAPPAAEGPALPACLLERLLGCPPGTWTVDDLVELARERGIRVVSLMHVGGDGTLKTLDFAPRSVAHLRDVLEGGERADGSSLFAGLGIRTGASDILLRPRPASAFLDPFSPLPTLALLCGHEGRDGEPLPQSPDTIVRRAEERLRAETGLELHALGEVEFFLGRRGGSGETHGDDRGYHATSPFVFGEALRRRALVTLAEIGVPLKYAHSEVGLIQAGEADGLTWEQHEIEMSLAPLAQAADGVALARWVLRNLAAGEGMRVSFEPILCRGHAGNGLHVHLSPVDAGLHRGGRGPDGALEPPARWLIGGLVQLGAALMAFGNRGEDSFVRLTQAKEAPSAIFWGEADRRALVRLPVVASTPDGRRVAPPTIEFRLPDGSALPHLLLAGAAQALVLGRNTPELERLLERTSAAGAAHTARPLGVPRSPGQVAEALAQHRDALEAGGVFPATLLDAVLGKLR